MAISKFANRAWEKTTTTGTGSSIALSGAVDNAHFTFAEAGVQDGDVVSYLIIDGTNVELQRRQTYSASGATLSRAATPHMSKIGGTAGTSQIELSGNATVVLVPFAEDFAVLQGTETAGLLIGSVGGEPAWVGFAQAGAGATTRGWQDKLREWVSVKDYGAVGDGSTNDTAAFEAAIAASKVVFVPPGNYLISAGFALPNGVHLFGPTTQPQTGSDFANFPAARILLTGTATGGIVNADTENVLLHGSLVNLAIQSVSGAQIGYLVDLRAPVSWTFMGLRIENTWSDGGGFRSRKIGENPTWLNRLIDTEVRVPDESTKYALDIDWSDSDIVGGAYTGGLGSIIRSPGNMHATCVMWDRANTGGAGLTLSKETESNGEINIVGCTFDANEGPGLLFRGDQSPSGAIYAPNIIGCSFRNPSATYDIVFDSNVPATLNGPVISGCSFTQSGVTPISIDTTKWVITLGPNYYANTAWLSDVFGDDRSKTALALLGRDGIHIPGPVYARATMTFRGCPNVSGVFDAPVSTSPALLVGAKDGATPFIAASLSSSGAASDLLFRTGNVDRLFLSGDGSALRPAADNTMQLGASTFRFSSVFAATGTISTSDEREKRLLGEPDEMVLDAVLSVPIVAYQWNDAIDKKGEDGARIHFGVTAQAVRAAFEAKGLDPRRYGLFVEEDGRFGLRYDQFDRLRMEAIRRRLIAPQG